jgi:hypothetical protein
MIKTIYQPPDWPSNCDLVLSSKIIAHTDECISLYPNPANNYLTIEPLTALQSISIFSFDGRLIRFIEVHESNRPVTLPVGHLQPGTYLERIVTGEKVLSKIFVISN